LDKVGERIRLLRQEKGMSQKQLAGSDITRAFISQVESGKSKPSIGTLRIIASRLGKPVDYFIKNIDYDQTVAVLLRECNSLFEKGHFEEAKSIVNQVINLSYMCERRELEGDAYFLHGKLNKKNSDVAFEYFQKAEEVFHEINHRVKFVQTLFELANCHFRNEDFKQALRYYQRVIQYASTLKTLQDTLASTYIFSGSAALRVGDFNLSIHSYENAVKTLNGLNAPKKTIDCQLGLGWCYFLLGHNDKAISITLNGITLSRLHNKHQLTQLEQNLAIMYSRKGDLQASYALLNQCLTSYQASGNIVKQAAIHEELARYWVRMENPHKAITACQKGLDLLVEKNGILQRGRIYRMLAEIHQKSGEQKRALELCRMGIDCFRIVDAAEEIKASEELLNACTHV
jgi:HTH-type transcriptional regulator, quorum sensing regulator NprR